MSNARKLQTEIDRVMKKVDEGVELFDDIWEKVYTAEQQNQKEKYEMDLKKEIKKLQRLRDQIKTWIGSSEVKDKDALLDARKLIETKMEQFKICEKETKTKTYSKEGLAREEKLDPAEEAKLSTTTWLGEYLERFQTLVEENDFEVEKLSSGKGKKSNKHQIEELQQHILNHKFHISKLEGIIRLVNNDLLEAEAVDQIKDDLDYYLESYNEETYKQGYDEDFIYETLGLEELDVVNVDRLTQVNSSASKKGTDDTISTSSKGSKSGSKSKKSSLSSIIPLTIGRARVTTASDKAKTKEEEKPTPTKLIRSSTASSVSSSTKSDSTPTPTPTVIPAAKTVPSTTTGASMASILKRETEQQEKERQKSLREQQARVQAEQVRQQQESQQQEKLRQQQAQQEALKQQQQQQQAEALRQQQEALVAKQQQQQAQLQAQQSQHAQQQQNQHKQQLLQNQADQNGSKHSPPLPIGQNGQSNALDLLTSGLGGLGLGNVSDKRVESLAPVVGENNVSVLSSLNESFTTAPQAIESERSRQYTPQNPYPTPVSFPSTPSALFENPAVFEKLGTDCLFFIFYYAQGTYQQYLAARELKKQSWRFHKKYMTWFQRHEEPKITTDEYEQGTYVYFDYESGWCTRIKTDFRFEYTFLEDSLQ